MRFHLEAPELSIDQHLNLGTPTESVAIVGAPGKGKTLLAVTMAAAMGGPQIMKLQNFRGKFPILGELGEGASATFTPAANQSCTVSFFPYGADSKPNWMEFEVDESGDAQNNNMFKPTYTLFGIGNFVVATGFNKSPIKDALSGISVISQTLNQLGIAATPQLIARVQQYINRPTPPSNSCLLCAFAMLVGASFSWQLVLDVQNPGLHPTVFADLHEHVLKLAKSRSIKVISFLPPRQVHQSEYDVVIKL